MPLHHCVYVIQLGPAENRVLYVGSTGKTRDERLAEHRSGRRAAKACKRIVGLLGPEALVLRNDLLPRFNERLTLEQSQLIERTCAEDLTHRGYCVHWG